VEGTQLVDEARAAFLASDWESARELFERALELEPSAEALDGLGQVVWWLGEEEAASDLRTRAFDAYRHQGDTEAAANVAIYLAAEHRIAGNASLANGWFGRATRELEGCGDCTARVWFHIERSKRAPDPAEAEREARVALELARRIDDPALEGSALSHAGRALIEAGDDAAGMALLDEALAVATGADLGDPLAIGDACCTTLTACETLADPRRTLDWGRAISDFFRRHRYLPLLSWCRSVYASFLVAAGRWEEAESTLEVALAEEETLPKPSRAVALVQRAELRRRQGRLEDAERLLAGLEDRPGALATAVGLRLARGDVELAGEKVERAIEAAGAPSAHLLRLRAEVALARGDAEAAVEASAECAARAGAAGRDDLVAVAAILSARAGAADTAGLELAIERLAELGMPFEQAEARIELARAIAAGSPQSAIEQGRAALSALTELGAARQADEAAALLRELGAPGRAAPRTAEALTKREQEVLALLAEGLSNPQIAERLVISPRTAEHHVRSVLRKLELSNRAEAAAYAARGGMFGLR
jgi:DNA-binding CsgD family transcriptional regulator